MLLFYAHNRCLQVIKKFSFSLVRYYSTVKPLDYWGVTSFTDGEGCFDVSITENKNLQLGWKVQHRFIIVSHLENKALLEFIHKHLGVGKIYKHGPQSVQLQVLSKKD